MNSWEMLVETPAPFSEVADWPRHPGHATESQCSSCGVGSGDPWYPAEDVMVVRHWTSASVDEPSGGKWTWYCADHFDRRAGNWWPSSYLAPAHLLPAITHVCERPAALRSVCGEPAVEPFDGVWLCERHAEVERVIRRISDLFDEE